MEQWSPVADEDLPEGFLELATPELQRYIHEPPGEGMGVIYAHASPVAKLYIGQHCHGQLGQSFAKARMNKLADPGCAAIYDGFVKFGKENMRHFIIAHCPEGGQYDMNPSKGDSNDLEIKHISGFNTMVPNGYNLKPGGCGGPTPQITIDRIKAVKNTLESKAKYQETLKKPDVQARIRAGFSTESFFEKRSAASKANNARPEVKAAQKAGNERRWAKPGASQHSTDLQRAKTRAKDEAKFLPLLAACKTESERGKIQKQWDQLERNRASQRRYDTEKRAAAKRAREVNVRSEDV